MFDEAILNQFNIKLFLQPLIHFPNVSILYRGGWSSSRFNPNVSFVVFQVNGVQIAMASYHFSNTAQKVKDSEMYQKLRIVYNVSLRNLPHGSAEDTPETNMPLFEEAADAIHRFNENKGVVLVNCHHGRSRTGAAVALYLMKYQNFKASEAISIVAAMHNVRGISESIDIRVPNPHGNYGDWLRRWEAQRTVQDKENDQQPLRNEKRPASDESEPGRFFSRRPPPALRQKANEPIEAGMA